MADADPKSTDAVTRYLFPYPVAVLYKRREAASAPGDRLRQHFDVAEGLLRFLVLVCMADHAPSAAEKDVKRRLDTLRAPGMGSLRHTLVDLVRSLDAPFVHELKGLVADASPDGWLAAIDAITGHRNDVQHGRVPLPAQAALLETVKPLLQQVLTAVQALRHYHLGTAELVRPLTDGFEYRWRPSRGLEEHGDPVTLRTKVAVLNHAPLLLDVRTGEALFLPPFLRWRDTEADGSEHLFWLDRQVAETGKAAVWCYRHPVLRFEHAEDLFDWKALSERDAAGRSTADYVAGRAGTPHRLALGLDEASFAKLRDSAGPPPFQEKYEIRGKLGEGAMGVVWEAFDRGLRRPVALKVLQSEQLRSFKGERRFKKEAKLLASLPHPPVVQIYDYAVTPDGQPFISMELLRGEDLQRYLDAKGALGADEAVAITRKALVALSRIHAANVVHRDVKPSNLFLVGDELYVLDFGIARGDGSTDTGSSSVGGTLPYMAPEQRYGKSDARSDVFSAGILLFALLAGRTPKQHESLATACPDAPAHVVRAYARATAEDPAKRFATAADFETALATDTGEGMYPVQPLTDVKVADSHGGSAPPPRSMPRPPVSVPRPSASMPLDATGHPLHVALAAQLAERLKARRIVVLYDPSCDLAPFFAELRTTGPKASGKAPCAVKVAGLVAQLFEYDGSFLELRMAVEHQVDKDEVEPVLIYVPGQRRDHNASLLMEVEKAGEYQEAQLKRVAKDVLRLRYTDGVVDELLAPETVTYADLARAAGSTSVEPPSLLKVVFHDAGDNDAILTQWLATTARDAAIEEKNATLELTKLLRSRIGLDLAVGPVGKLRANALRYVLAGEFRADLRCPPPPSLDGVPKPPSRAEEAVVRDLASRLRATYPTEYAGLADQVEAELGLRDARIPAEALGSVDTFRFEERALLDHCGALIAAKRFADAKVVVGEREQSFWLDRDFSRRAQWEAYRRMADLGTACVSVGAEVSKAGPAAAAWVEAYTRKEGWFRIDQAQRQLETWLASIDDEPSDKPLGVVRRLYEDVCHAMADGFTKAMVKAHWTVPGALHQTKIFGEVVSQQPKPVAYFFVDAMRFEMALDLVERLAKSAEIGVRAAISVLPSITPLGMAALLPGAAGSYCVVEEKERLGVRIDDSFLPDLASRKKLAAARVPQLVDLTLDELLGMQRAKLGRRLEGAQMVIVRSQEIDHAGEGAFSYQARQVMDNVIENLARAIRRLADAGIEHSVVTADHGHLFFANDRDESMRTDSPGGQKVELHRRCWIGRGGANPPGTIRVTAADLGYASDLDFVFPVGSGVFKAGGDLQFHHGGPSLQEMVIPVVTVRLKLRESMRPAPSAVRVVGLPDAVTNRIFTVTLQLGDSLTLFPSPMMVRPMLVAAGRQVGDVGMAVDAELDRATGSVKLHPGKPVTVALLLKDESVPALRVVVQDPSNDAELYRSPADIPVRLGV